MKKKTQKALIVGLVGISLVCLGTTAALFNAKTGAIDRVFTEETETSGSYSVEVFNLVEATSTKDATFKSVAKIEDVGSPFKEAKIEFKSYGDEDHPATVVVGETNTCSYIEEMKITLTLADNVDFYIGSVSVYGFAYTNTDESCELETSVKVGNHGFELYDNHSIDIFMNKNVYSGDVVITIKNPVSNEKKLVPGTFTIGEIAFNYLDDIAFEIPSAE